jgi:phage gp36-like protein
MSYATQAQLVERYGEQMMLDLTDRAEPPAGEIDGDVVDRALADTDAIIDGFLKGRYALPLATTPTLVTQLAIDISIYKLHRTVASEKIEKDYKQALATLRDIANGTVRLDVAGAEPASSGNNGVRVNDRPRDMTPDNLKGWV